MGDHLPPEEFAIFRASSDHLLAGRDLYAPDPAHYADQFKYSPTFALLFIPLAALPFAPALFLWSALNALALAGAVAVILPPRRAAIALAIMAMEMFGAMQTAQSNALVVASIILAYAAFERDHPVSGAALSALGACIKIYPLAGLVCAVPRRQALRAGLRRPPYWRRWPPCRHSWCRAVGTGWWPSIDPGWRSRRSMRGRPFIVRSASTRSASAVDSWS